MLSKEGRNKVKRPIPETNAGDAGEHVRGRRRPPGHHDSGRLAGDQPSTGGGDQDM
jgi:hypothetical protein